MKVFFTKKRRVEMKYKKILIALMSISVLSACGNLIDEKIIGTWKGKTEIGGKVSYLNMTITKVDDNHYKQEGMFLIQKPNGTTETLKDRSDIYVVAGENKLCVDNTCSEFMVFNPDKNEVHLVRHGIDLILTK